MHICKFSNKTSKYQQTYFLFTLYFNNALNILIFNTLYIQQEIYTWNGYLGNTFGQLQWYLLVLSKKFQL